VYQREECAGSHQRHEKTKSPVLRHAYDSPQSPGGLRTIEIDKRAEERLLAKEGRAEYGKTRQQTQPQCGNGIRRGRVLNHSRIILGCDMSPAATRVRSESRLGY
jgi:hypothetical protein